MAAQSLVSDIGFAEFVGKLLAEVFDSVVTSQIDQEKRIAEVLDAAGRTAEEIADRFVTGEALAAELVRLFPGATIAENGSYVPAGGTGVETPAFAVELGIQLQAGTDFRSTAGGSVLTAAGAEKLRAAVRLRLATDQLNALRQLATRGIPRLVVEAGKVNAKMTIQLTTVTPATAGVAAALGSTARRRFPEAAQLPGPAELRAIRLAVRPVSDRAPQATQLQVNVYGEVEVRFKTVL